MRFTSRFPCTFSWIETLNKSQSIASPHSRAGRQSLLHVAIFVASFREMQFTGVDVLDLDFFSSVVLIKRSISSHLMTASTCIELNKNLGLRSNLFPRLSTAIFILCSSIDWKLASIKQTDAWCFAGKNCGWSLSQHRWAVEIVDPCVINYCICWSLASHSFNFTPCFLYNYVWSNHVPLHIIHPYALTSASWTPLFVLRHIF